MVGSNRNKVKKFDKANIRKLYVPPKRSKGEDNGQVTIVGGSKLFHGAPLYGVKIASRIVDMVFFSSPEPSVGRIAESLKSKLFSFIWVPWGEVSEYIAKSDAVLIGPGFQRFRSEKTPHGLRHHACDKACQKSRKITLDLFTQFPEKKWVVDGGSLQVITAEDLPNGAIVTPNSKEFKVLFGDRSVQEAAKGYSCTVVLKGPETVVSNGEKTVKVMGGNAGLTKGGTGDVQAGLTAAFLAKNDSFLAAAAAAFVTKSAADVLFKKVGTNYNADDLASIIPEFLHEMRK